MELLRINDDIRRIRFPLDDPDRDIRDIGNVKLTHVEINELREGNHEQWGPDAKVWDWYLATYAAEFEEHDFQELTDKLRQARAVQGSWLTRRRAFAQRENRFLNLLDARICGQRDTLYDDFVHENMERAGKLENWFHMDHCLLWIGGTYACNPQDFPEEQNTPEWRQRHLLPLEIGPPAYLFAWGKDFTRRWLSARWHGKPPHPFAMQQPFPYSAESMQKMAGWRWVDEQKARKMLWSSVGSRRA